LPAIYPRNHHLIHHKFIPWKLPRPKPPKRIQDILAKESGVIFFKKKKKKEKEKPTLHFKLQIMEFK